MSLPAWTSPSGFAGVTAGWPFELKAALRLVSMLALLSPKGVPDDAAYLTGQLGCSTRKWNILKRKLVEVGALSVRGGWLRLGSMRGARPGLSADVKAVAAARLGHQCAYCGSTEGPFEHDHIIARSKGGSDAPNNIILTCKACNRDKRDMSLVDWVRASR